MQKTDFLRIQATESPRTFRRLISRERLSEGDQNKAVIVPDIFNMAAEFIIEQRLLNQNDTKLEKARKHLVRNAEEDIDTLCNDFEEKAIFKNEITPLQITIKFNT